MSAHLIDIIRGALVDDVLKYHSPEWVARAQAAVAAQPVQQRAAVLGQEPYGWLTGNSSDHRQGTLQDLTSNYNFALEECAEYNRDADDPDHVDRVPVPLYTAPVPAAGVQGDRFYMDHGLWHDRVTGQHMWTQDQYDEHYRDGLAVGRENAEIVAVQPESGREAALVQQLREYAGNAGYSHNDYADTMRQVAEALAALPANGAQAELSVAHRAVIAEAAQVLESAAAHNKSESRTVLAHDQQMRADRLREVLLAATPQKKEG